MRYLCVTVLFILSIAVLVSGCGKSEEDYKKVAVQVNYEELSRKPDNYKEKPMAFSSKIVNVTGNGKDVELLFAAGKTPILVHYSLKANEERYIAGDFVRVWGDFQKVSSKKVGDMASEATMIEVDAKYISHPTWAFLVDFMAMNTWTTEKNGKVNPLDPESMQISLHNKKVNPNNIDIQGIITLKNAYFNFKGVIDDNGVGEIEYTDEKGNSKNIKGKIVLKNRDEVEIETPKIDQAKKVGFLHFGEPQKTTLITIEEGKYTLTRKTT